MTFIVTPEMVFSITSKKEFTEEQMEKFDAKVLKERKKELAKLCVYRPSDSDKWDSPLFHLRRFKTHADYSDFITRSLRTLRALQVVRPSQETTENFKHFANVDDAVKFCTENTVPFGFTVHFSLPHISGKQFGSILTPKFRTIPGYMDNWGCTTCSYLDPKTKESIYCSAVLYRFRS